MFTIGKAAAATGLIACTLIGGGAGAALVNSTANAATSSSTGTSSTSGPTGRFTPNENATHEAGESAAREAQENAGQVPTVP